MKTIQLQGIIKFEYNTWNKLKLIQPDGYKIDVVDRFKEAKESFPKSKFQVNYWLFNNPCTKDEILEGFLRKLYGDISADYESNNYCYSSYSSGTYFDTTLQIGGHNLISELSSEQDRFIFIELNIDDVKS